MSWSIDERREVLKLERGTPSAHTRGAGQEPRARRARDQVSSPAIAVGLPICLTSSFLYGVQYTLCELCGSVQVHTFVTSESSRVRVRYTARERAPDRATPRGALRTTNHYGCKPVKRALKPPCTDGYVGSLELARLSSCSGCGSALVVRSALARRGPRAPGPPLVSDWGTRHPISTAHDTVSHLAASARPMHTTQIQSFLYSPLVVLPESRAVRYPVARRPRKKRFSYSELLTTT